MYYTGNKYQQDDDDLFGDGNDEDEGEVGAHVRPSDLQKQVMTQSIRDLEAQRRVTSGLEVFSVSEAAAESAKALAAEEKSRREVQTQASSVSKLLSEAERAKKEEEEQKQKQQEEGQEQKKLEEERKQEKKKKEEEQKIKAVQSANAERIRVEQSEKDCNSRISTDEKRAAAPGRSGTCNPTKFQADGLVEGTTPYSTRSVLCFDSVALSYLSMFVLHRQQIPAR